MPKYEIFDPYNVDEQVLLLRQHFPPGKFWEGILKYETNLGKLMLGLSAEFYRFEVLTRDFVNEMNIDKTNKIMIDWEKSLGLPDSCFPPTTDLTERRNAVKMKYSKFGGVQTAEDFIRIANFFGFDLVVQPGGALGMFPLRFPVLFFDSITSSTHTVFMQLKGRATADTFFPVPFPIPFSKGGITFLRCIFTFLAPANVKVIIKDV